jgi:type VI secretion system protein ImpM
MSGATVGFFGKLPSHGDFIERRVGESFHQVWDDWLQRSIDRSHNELGGKWLDCYLTSPIWRFFLSDGVAGAAAYAGILLPSVDKVGRYFPLTVVVELPPGTPALQFAQAASRWFTEVEHLCADALQDAAFNFDTFDAALAGSSERLNGTDQLPSPPPFPGISTQWHWPLRSVEDVTAPLAVPFISMAQASLRPMTMWWTEGSELVHPSVLLASSLPRPESFADLLAGTWAAGRWDGDVTTVPHNASLEPLVHVTTTAAAATDAGTVRTQNQDKFLVADANRLWAVADGMGGLAHGEVASQMVIDALNSLEPAATLNAVLEGVDVALGRVNSDLQRAALGVAPADPSGSTVVVLAIRGGEWGVAWAGDSRAYVYRGQILIQLTKDHTAQTQGAFDDTLVPSEITRAATEIERAVGAEDVLELDHNVDRVVSGDRFLLCSDGLYGSLDRAAIIACLRHSSAQEACQSLIDAARAAHAADNVTAVIVDVAVEDASNAVAT